MDVSMEKNFIHLILFLSLFLIGCSNIAKNDVDEIAIRIGEYTVSQQQYEGQLKQLTTIHDGWTREGAALFLLDNYISSGLLVESAKKMNYKQQQDFIKGDSTYKQQLIIKYSKYFRANTGKSSRIDNSLTEKISMLQNKIKIDYIRIPKEHKKLSELMFEYLISKISISNLMENPELTTWDDMGLSFYEDISLKHVVLSDRIIKKIITMQDNEVKIIKANSAYYVIRVKYPPQTNMDEDSQPILLNQLMARSLENGDMIFDSYRLKKSIQCDESLLSRIDFSIEPFCADSSFTAKIGDRFISENEIREKISELPVRIQCLFINNSTRARAIATLVLLNYYHEENPEETYFQAKGRFQKMIFSTIKEGVPEDTIAFFKKWITNEFDKYSTTFNNNLIHNKGNRNILHNKKPEQIDDWLQPGKIIGYDQLRLDFGKIEKMKITQKDTIDNQILAYSDHWSLTIKDFKEELDKLTPITRLELARNNLLNEMIKYLAKRNSIHSSKLTINSNHLESIDIMGKSYDQLNDVFDESTIVGSLGSIGISVSELRELVIKLPEFERNKFLNLLTRKESFYEIITEKFWVNLYDRKTIEDNPDLKKEISNYQNKLLVELLYKHELQVNVPQIDDEHLNLKIQQAVKSINEDKLFSYIQEVMRNHSIQVNSDFFQEKLNLDIGTSKYNKVIVKNIN